MTSAKICSFWWWLFNKSGSTGVSSEWPAFVYILLFNTPEVHIPYTIQVGILSARIGGKNGCGTKMKQKEIFKGVPGMLRPFKEFIETRGLKAGDQIVYYGCPGTCTPFVELLGYAIRGLDPVQVFVPFIDESKAKKMKLVEDVGMQAAGDITIHNPSVVVVMGGLSMPNVPVSAGQVLQVISPHKNAVRIGVCFMNMFDKAGWNKEIEFDLLIDAAINPVEVWK
jgi:hypothetical protein